MRKNRLFRLLIIAGILFTACRSVQPQIIASPIVVTKPATAIPVTPVIATKIPSNTPDVIELRPTIPARIATIELGIPLSIPRTRHTATVLPNGKVLLLGGTAERDDYVADEELFDFETGSINWITPLHTPRCCHSATLLQDGRILVVGGYNLPHQWLRDAEVYDPVSDTWTVLPPHYPHGSAHTATLMKDGRVLVVGGCVGSGVCTDKVEIFDPKTNQWMKAHSLESDRWSHTAQLLDDGRVLIVGGLTAGGDLPIDGNSLAYDPEADAWSPVATMISPHTLLESVKLPNGDVLVAGGLFMQVSPPQSSNDVEIYSPVYDTWRQVAPMNEARYGYILIQLPDGRIIAADGARDWECCWTETSFVSEIEIYEPANDRWKIIGNLPEPGAYATGVAFADGTIWIAGGQVGEQILTDTWLFHVPSP